MGDTNGDNSLRKRTLSEHQRSLMSIISETLPPPVEFDALRMSDEQLSKVPNKRIREFYKKQNTMINRFLEVDHVLESLKRGQDPHDAHFSSSLSQEEAQQTEMSPLLARHREQNKPSAPWVVHLAINLSFVANVILFLTKVLVAWFSGSMAILASAFESFLDIVSNAIIFFTIRIIRQKDYHAYPVGKARMEPLGIIVFAVIITTSFSQVLMSSVQRLVDPSSAGKEIELGTMALILLGTNIVVKLALWMWCATIRGSSSVDALAHDHENDVVFSVAGFLFPIVGIWMHWPWLDPVGAILLSVYIIYEWMVILLDNIRRLTGQSASADDIKQLTYMAYRFSTKVLEVDTVRAYYLGDRLLVEVDIVLPPDCPLQEAHDVGEALQDALEMMDNVERAFVHLDYSSHHEIEHRRAVDGAGFGR